MRMVVRDRELVSRMFPRLTDRISASGHTGRKGSLVPVETGFVHLLSFLLSFLCIPRLTSPAHRASGPADCSQRRTSGRTADDLSMLLRWSGLLHRLGRIKSGLFLTSLVTGKLVLFLLVLGLAFARIDKDQARRGSRSSRR